MDSYLSTYAHLIQQGRKLDKDTTLRKLAAAAHRPRAHGCPNGGSPRTPGLRKTPKNTEPALGRDPVTCASALRCVDTADAPGRRG